MHQARFYCHRLAGQAYVHSIDEGVRNVWNIRKLIIYLELAIIFGLTLAVILH
jgi:hypothetical protein